jgi:hypothetical protein
MYLSLLNWFLVKEECWTGIMLLAATTKLYPFTALYRPF